MSCFGSVSFLSVQISEDGDLGASRLPSLPSLPSLRAFKRYSEFKQFSCEFNVLPGRPLTILVGNGPPIIDSESEEEQECNANFWAGTPSGIPYFFCLLLSVNIFRLSHSDCRFSGIIHSTITNAEKKHEKPLIQSFLNFEAGFCMTQGVGTCEELLCIQDPKASKIEDLT